MRAVFLITLTVAALVIGGCVETRMTEIPENAVIVDVRTGAEYSMNHLSCAKSLPLSDSDDPAVSKQVADGSQPVVVYCLSGHRSVTAKKRLEALGYESVYDGGSMYSLHRLIAETQPDSPCRSFAEGKEEEEREPEPPRRSAKKAPVEPRLILP